MSAIAEVKEEVREMTGVKKITYQKLQPGDEFWIVREKKTFSPLNIQEVWQFEVLEILPEIAKVNVVFPSGHEEVGYFKMAAIGEWLKVYNDPEKTGYFLDDNIIGIVVL